MKVFGLQAPIYRGARLASRLTATDATPPGATRSTNQRPAELRRGSTRSSTASSTFTTTTDPTEHLPNRPQPSTSQPDKLAETRPSHMYCTRTGASQRGARPV
jgi:hypothetical protein